MEELLPGTAREDDAWSRRSTTLVRSTSDAEQRYRLRRRRMGSDPAERY
jgi:hypothetical protein